jgi:tetratricopeptide (TPR) repeat protein
LALAYAIAGRTARALPLLEQAQRAAPDDVEVLLYLAEAYRNGRRPDQAIPLYERAIRLDRNQVTASVGLGSIRMERGEFTEAIRLWQDALSKNAGLELVRTNLAQAQWRSGDLPAAESTLRRAIEINPGFAAPLDLLQTLRRALGR